MGRPKHSSGKAQIITETQQRRLFQSINGTANERTRERNRCMMTISLKLGLRAKELAALNVDDVVDSQGNVRDVLRLTTDKTKGEVHRDLPLTNKAVRDGLRAYLDVLGKKSGPLFLTQRRNRFSPNSMQACIKRIFEDAGFDGKFTSHSGRRTFITSLARKGFDVNSIRQLAGHSSLATTQGYIENDPAALEKMMRAL